MVFPILTAQGGYGEMKVARLPARIRDQLGFALHLGWRVTFLWLSVCLATLAVLFALGLHAGVQRAAATFVSLQGTMEGQVFQPTVRGSRAIRRADLDVLRRALPGILFTGFRAARMELSAGGHTIAAIVNAQDSYQDPASRKEHLKLVAGSWLDETDDRSAATVCVLSAPLAARLFPQGSAVGRTVRIGHVHFRVKGVVADRDEATLRKLKFGAGRKWFVARVPLATGTTRLFPTDRLSALVFRSADVEVAAAKVRRTLKELGRAVEDMTFETPSFYRRAMLRGTKTVRSLAWAMGFVGLLLGAGVIATVVSTHLSQFSAELALRRALGGSATRVCWDLVLGVVLLATPGIAAGVTLGAVAAAIVRSRPDLSSFSPMRFLTVSPSLWIPGVVIAYAAVGLAGFGPAWKASRRSRGGEGADV